MLENDKMETASTKVTQPAFQRRINVVSTLWINVENNLKQRWYNVDKTLFQPSFDVTILNQIGLVMIMDLQIHK